MEINLSINNNKLFLLQNKYSFWNSFRKAPERVLLDSLFYSFYYAGDKAVLVPLLNSYLKNKTPIVWIDTNRMNFGNSIIGKIDKSYTNVTYLSKEIKKEEIEKTYIDFPNFSIQSYQESLMKSILNNHISIARLPMNNVYSFEEEQYKQKVKNLFLYLDFIKSKLDTFPPFIFIFSNEIHHFNKDDTKLIHSYIKHIKSKGHTVITLFHLNRDIFNTDEKIFGDEKQYNHYIFATEGYSLEDIKSLRYKEAFPYFPNILKEQLQEPEIMDKIIKRNIKPSPYLYVAKNIIKLL